jgi:uncharacterized phage protein (TIGR02220 family)
MAESKIKNENFITIMGFMVNDLNLKGNELLVYSIIYGFSQAENQIFTGSLQYLADWTNSTKQGIMKVLKSLMGKELILKNEKYFNGVKFVEYYATKFNGGMQQSCIGGMKQSLTNNISSDIITDIIDYMNSTCKVNFKAKSKNTIKLINARFRDGYVIEDFKAVILKKYNSWKDTKMEQYLRPSTLFGNKFEGYFNEKIKGVNNGRNKQDNGQSYDGDLFKAKD